MRVSVQGKDWLFLLICFVLAMFADLAFLRGEIGVSYIAFITAFYLVVFLRFGFSFQHRRIGLLLMAAIWLLSSSFVLYDVLLFKMLNVLLIPLLVFIHLVLMMQPNTFVWETPRFIQILLLKFGRALVYVKDFGMTLFYLLTKGRNPAKVKVAKQVFIGLFLGLPLLFVIMVLLMAADQVFLEAMLRLPAFMFRIDLVAWVYRAGFVVFATFLFFGVLQVLAKERGQAEKGLVHTVRQAPFRLDRVMVFTVLVLMIGMYGLFFGVKFTYLFHDSLVGGFTYAEYARRGFYELLAVVLINWSVLLVSLGRTKTHQDGLSLLLKIAYSLIIIASGVLLISAFGRLSMYELAYGFTVDRFLAHAFMVFLFVIFAYTFIRVWLERLQVLHFYLIVGLIFYVGLNMFDMNQFIVDKNMERYEAGASLDMAYFRELGPTGWTALLELAETDPDAEGLQNELASLPCFIDNLYGQGEEKRRWQSYNFKREAFIEKYEELYGKIADAPSCGEQFEQEEVVW